MVLQTFGAHWMAVVGARKLHGINYPTLPVRKPVGGLGLTVAEVSAIISYRFVLTHFACTIRSNVLLPWSTMVLSPLRPSTRPMESAPLSLNQSIPTPANSLVLPLHWMMMPIEKWTYWDLLPTYTNQVFVHFYILVYYVNFSIKPYILK